MTERSPAPASAADGVHPLGGRRVLVTGGAGFIGSHLCEELLGRGAEVVVLDDLSTGSAANLAHLIGAGRLRLLRGSIRREQDVERAFACDPDVVFHLAAAVGVRLIVERPVDSIETNIRGTETVLACAAQINARTLIASSSEVYGKGLRVPFREDDDLVLGPTTAARWSYGCSKMIDEYLALAYHRAQGLPATVLRFFNTVGPRQTGRYGMVIPRLTEQALAGRELTVYGDGSQTRAFCHVRDTVRMIADLAERAAAVGEVFNVGNDEEISIGDLARRIIARAGSSSTVRHIPFAEAYDANFEDVARRVPTIDKLARLLGYRPGRGIDLIIDDVRESCEERKRQEHRLG